MRLAPRLVLAFGFVAALSVAGLGVVVREDQRATETERFEQEVKSACDRVVAEIGRQAESDRKLVAGACQSGELVDRALIWLEAGDPRRRTSPGALAPRPRRAPGVRSRRAGARHRRRRSPRPGPDDAPQHAALRGRGARRRGRRALRAPHVRRPGAGRADGALPQTRRRRGRPGGCRGRRGGRGRRRGCRRGAGRREAPGAARRAPRQDARHGRDPRRPAVRRRATSRRRAARYATRPARARSSSSASRRRSSFTTWRGSTRPRCTPRSRPPLVALLLAVLLARSLGGPIAELAAEARKVASGEARPLRVRGAGEIAELAQAFDTMLVDLEATRRRLAATSRVAAWREVARRVAHEIKNPLAPIRAAVETLRRLRARQDPEFDAYFDQATRTVLDEVARIAGIVTEFTRFARLPPPRPEELDLVEVARQVVQMHQAAHADGDDARRRCGDSAARRRGAGNVADARAARAQATPIVADRVEPRRHARRRGGAAARARRSRPDRARPDEPRAERARRGQGPRRGRSGGGHRR